MLYLSKVRLSISYSPYLTLHSQTSSVTTEQVVADSSTSTNQTNAASTPCDLIDDEAEQALETHSKVNHHPLCPAEKAVHVSEHVRPQPYNQVLEHDLQQQQCTHPPLGQNRQCDDVLSKEGESEPVHVHTLVEDDLAKIMRDFTNNLTTDGLVESIREAVQDALKPP